jgi:hypothetical protein
MLARASTNDLKRPTAAPTIASCLTPASDAARSAADPPAATVGPPLWGAACRTDFYLNTSCCSSSSRTSSSAGAGLVVGALGVAAWVAAVRLRAGVRFGAARFVLVALARPRAGFLVAAALPRWAVVRRLALLPALPRFVVNPGLPAFLVVVVFPFERRARFAMASSFCRMSKFCRPFSNIAPPCQ